MSHKTSSSSTVEESSSSRRQMFVRATTNFMTGAMLDLTLNRKKKAHFSYD
eukprot:gene19334-24712_t